MIKIPEKTTTAIITPQLSAFLNFLPFSSLEYFYFLVFPLKKVA